MDVTHHPVIAGLLGAAIDFAGLFPPAALPMDRAVRDYLGYAETADAWALGSFIAPAARLDELLGVIPDSAPGITVSATIGAELEADVARIARFNQAGADRGHAVTAAEVKVADPAAARLAARQLGHLARWYGEVPLGHTDVLDALVEVGGRAKIRMGGVTADAFPPAGAVADFLVETAARRLPFKATAGLHHPIRGTYRLTYEPGAPSGTMYGYLNLLVATALACRGADRAAVEAALRLTAPAIRLEGGALTWPGGRIDAEAIPAVRRAWHGFGSCSFREPIDELFPAVSP